MSALLYAFDSTDSSGPLVGDAFREVHEKTGALLTALMEMTVELPQEAELALQVTEAVAKHLFPMAAAYAHCMDPERFQPRVYFFNNAQANETSTILATRECAVHAPTYDALRSDIEAFSELAGASEGLAVWLTLLPRELTGTDTRDVSLFGWARLLQADDELCFLYHAGKLRWLSATLTRLSGAVEGAMLIGGGALRALQHQRARNRLKKRTAEQLAAPAPGSARPPLSAKEATEAAEHLWGRDSPMNLELASYLSTAGQGNLEETTNALRALHLGANLMRDRIRKSESEVKKEFEKRSQRMTREAERLQMAYDGLKQRAARQDAELRELRRRATPVAPTPADDTRSPTVDAFQTALTALFQVPDERPGATSSSQG